MKDLYEIFEKFPDNTSLWKDSALGAKKARHKLMEMAEKAGNKFYAIDIASGEILKIDSKRGMNEELAVPMNGTRIGNQSCQAH